MKLLFDQNLSFRLCHLLADLFPDSQQVRLLGMDRTEDYKIWKYAQQNNFLIVTQDSDFYELSLLHGFPPKVLWLRCGNQPTTFIENLIRQYALEIIAFVSEDETACMEIY